MIADLVDSVATGWRDARLFEFGGGLEARAITERAELETLYRLRYRRYVEEQGKKYPNALNERLEDRLDQPSINVGLFAEGTLAAAVRLTWLDDVTPEDYLAPLKIALPREQHFRTVVCSRLVAEPSQGSVRSTMLLFLAAYHVGLARGGVRSVLSTTPDRCKSFASIGYRETGEIFSSPIFGMQVVMLLDMVRDDVRARFGRLLEVAQTTKSNTAPTGGIK
jgi:hypothetical protein